MAKVIFILPSISSGLEFWSANHTSTCESSKLKVFNNKNVLGKTSNNKLNDLLVVSNKCIQDSWIMLIINVDNIAMDIYFFSNF